MTVWEWRGISSVFHRLHESDIIASGSSSTHKVGTASMASVMHVNESTPLTEQEKKNCLNWQLNGLLTSVWVNALKKTVDVS